MKVISLLPPRGAWKSKSDEVPLPLYLLSYLTAPPLDTFLKINFMYPVWKGASPYYSYSALAVNGSGELWSQFVHSEIPAVLFTSLPFGKKGAHL